jgi:hypothetical protein
MPSRISGRSPSSQPQPPSGETAPRTTELPAGARHIYRRPENSPTGRPPALPASAGLAPRASPGSAPAPSGASPAGSRQRARADALPGGAPGSSPTDPPGQHALNAVRAGHPPGKVAFALDIADPAIQNSLKNVAALMRSSDPELRQLAEKADLHPDAAYPIQYAAAHGPALAAVRAGEPVYAVLERMGISDPDLAAPLKNVAVLVRSGDPAQRQFAQNADLGDPAQDKVLERMAAHGPAAASVKAGETPSAVAGTMGISDPLLKNDLKNLAALAGSADPALQRFAQSADLGDPAARKGLQKLAAHGPAMAAVKAGEPLPAVLAQVGISDPLLKNDLKNMAALVHSGSAGLRALAQQLRPGFGDPEARHHLARLEGVVVKHLAVQAVLAGEPAAAVFERMGIGQPQHRAQLEAVEQRAPAERAHAARLKNVAALASAGDPAVTARANELLQMADGGSAAAARRLEEVTARSVAADAVKGGESVPSVANRMGIARPDLLAELQAHHGEGRNRIIRGAQALPTIIE